MTTSLGPAALESLAGQDILPAEALREPVIERTRDASHGDFATNVAMVLSKAARTNPRELAEKVIAALPADSAIEKVEIAGPGFINFFVSAAAGYQVLPKILEQKHRFGRSTIGNGKRIQVEFVSANPTGPLHVGHGRGAAYGATVADLLHAAGFDVHREYYVNDAGRQMDILATSVWLRYLELAGEEVPFPSNGYQGDYVLDIAATLHREFGDVYRHASAEVFKDVPADEPDGGDKEEHIDALIRRAKFLLEETGYTAGNWQSLGSVESNPAFMNNHCHFWLARDVVKTDSQSLDAGEDIGVHELSLEELETAIADGRMRNSLSLLALGRVFDLRGIDLS